jgi:RNA polymerase sigma-70 factor (ECF subfamily)
MNIMERAMSLEPDGISAAEHIHSFDAVISEHQHYIYNLVLSLRSDADDADDITQDTFLKAIEGHKSFRGDSDIRTWLTRIAINTFLDSKRKIKPHVSLDLGIVACPSGEPERKIIKKEMQWSVRHVLLHHVSEEHKVVLVLRDMYGYSYLEIADILLISVPAVKSRLHRGRAAFYNHLVKSGCVSFVKDYTCYCEGATKYEVRL